jgi:hypothetical protein
MRSKPYLHVSLFFALSTILSASLMGCGKSANQDPIVKTDNKIIYVAGTSDTTNTPGAHRAVYWKDDQRVVLPYQNITPDFHSPSDVWAMTAIGNDIYIGGTNYDHAGYWKNGVFTTLNVGSNTVRAMTTDGKDVYTTMNTGHGYLCYKNTQLLGNGGPSIAIDGGNVYVLAVTNTPVSLQVNNVITTPVSSELAISEALAVSNGDVYIAGEGFTGNNNTLVVKLLKNNKLIYSATEESGVYQIAISGNDIYMVGYLRGASGGAAIWKNGVQTALEPKSDARAITLDDGDVYVAGHAEIGGIWKGCYWKNGVIHTLAPVNSAAKGIVIIKK